MPLNWLIRYKALTNGINILGALIFCMIRRILFILFFIAYIPIVFACTFFFVLLAIPLVLIVWVITGKGYFDNITGCFGDNIFGLPF